MADLKISQLTAGNPAQSSDVIPIDRASANFSITAGSIAALVPATPLLVLSASVGNTDTLTSATGGTQNFVTTYTIPANYLVANKLLRVTICLAITQSAAPPTIQFGLNIGGVTVYVAAANVPDSNQAFSGIPVSITFLVQGSAPASGSAAVYTHPTLPPDSVNGVFSPFTASPATTKVQPINLATNGTMVIQPTYKFGSATAGNSVTLQQMVVEALN